MENKKERTGWIPPTILTRIQSAWKVISLKLHEQLHWHGGHS